MRDGSSAIGKTVEELNLPDLCTVATITQVKMCSCQDDELIPPRGKKEFEEDERVILIGKPDEVILVSNLFLGNNSLKSLLGK